jgi:predicted helicase
MDKPFFTLMVSVIPDVQFTPNGQCFPFYTYAEDGSNRRENITDWALEQYQSHYADSTITKWEIFYSIYALLHQPSYRQKYAANLRRALPHIPFVNDFHGYAEIGRRLAELHVHYDKQPEYPLEWVENPAEKLNWRVERMKLSKDKRELIYNDFLTLRGIPATIFEYRLGNRSALEWVVDQYQLKTDKRSGLTNDPNDLDDERATTRLIGQVITVSIETVKLVGQLPLA